MASKDMVTKVHFCLIIIDLELLESKWEFQRPSTGVLLQRELAQVEVLHRPDEKALTCIENEVIDSIVVGLPLGVWCMDQITATIFVNTTLEGFWKIIVPVLKHLRKQERVLEVCKAASTWSIHVFDFREA